MPWNAILIDGPLEGRTLTVEEELGDEPPSVMDVEGERYVYCGFAEHTPRYRHDGAADTG